MLLATTDVLTLPFNHQNLETKILSSVSSQAGIQSQLRLIPRIGIRFRSKLQLVSSVDKISLINEAKKRTRGKNGRLSVSSDATAWGAMVPSKESKEKPWFPESLEWVMVNQQPNGSWCPNLCRPLHLKESLSSTLACVLALHKWKLGQSLVKKGLKFIEANCWAAIDEKQVAPVGFDFTFLSMIELAIESGLTIPLDPDVLDVLWQKRDTEVARLEGTKSDLAYLLEGIGKKFESEKMIKHQRSNGSFYISPSASATAMFYNHNEQCCNYLTFVLKKFDNAEIYSQLCVIDNILKLGLNRYCRSEIESILDNTYRFWLQRDEKIVLDTICCALGFRLLRMNGYDVSSEALARFSEEHFFNSVNPQFTNTNTILELFKASKLMIYEKEDVLEKLEAWTGSFLKQQLLAGAIEDQKLRQEVDHILKYRYGSLDFLESRWTIELQQHKTNTAQLLNTSNRNLIDNDDKILALAIEDYNMCQSLYQEEYKDLERWVKDCRFHELKFARVPLYCYYANTAVLVAPELADARLSISKNCILTTVIDDLFDVSGSKEEMENLIQLTERWGETSSVGYCSEQVEIIFAAFKDMIAELDAIAFKHHGRSVEHHLVKIWHDLLKSMMKEAEWAVQENESPTLDEYIENAYISFTLGPICHITTYFLGITLPEEVMAGPEIYNLFKHVSLVGRLLNDIKSFKREREQGKHNSISLRVLHSQGTMTEEAAIVETKRDLEKYRKELLRLVVQKEETSLPKPIRDLFWKFCNVLHYFYMENDGYSNPKHEMANDEKAVLWEPITSSFL